MASLLWTCGDEKFNTSNVILCPAALSNFGYNFLMFTKIIKQNDMVKEDVKNFYEFISTYYFIQTFHSHDICQEFVKKWTATMVIILWEFFMFYQIFLSSQMKRSLIISKKLVYMSSLRSCRTIWEIRKLGKLRIMSKVHGSRI